MQRTEYDAKKREVRIVLEDDDDCQAFVNAIIDKMKRGTKPVVMRVKVGRKKK